MELYKIYNILLNEYGFQLWWPVTREGQAKPEYIGGPKNDKQRLEVAIGAVLAQNTSWKNVEKAIINLSKNSSIDIQKIRKIEKEKLEEIIKPSGFYKQKAERLKILADFLENKRFDNIERDELLSLKGIGPETADSILLYACEKPEFVVDTYTKRIFSRLGLIDNTGYSEVKKFFQDNLNGKENLVQIYQEFHALIVEHAKRYCKKEPDCERCPLRKQCKYYKREKQ